MKKRLIELSAILGLIGLFMAGMGTTPIRADEDYRYIPNDHRPLTFANYDDGYLHFRSHKRTRSSRRKPVNEPIQRRTQEAPSAERSRESLLGAGLGPAIAVDGSCRDESRFIGMAVRLRIPASRKYPRDLDSGLF